eukprot:1674744-Pleurochrysis_carterae.AAC.1
MRLSTSKQASKRRTKVGERVEERWADGRGRGRTGVVFRSRLDRRARAFPRSCCCSARAAGRSTLAAS